MTSTNDQPTGGTPAEGFDWDAAAKDLAVNVPADAVALAAESDQAPTEILEGEVIPAQRVDSSEAQRAEKWSWESFAAAERRDVLPGFVKSWEEFRDRLNWAIAYAAHTAAYHAVRVPKYAAKLALRAPCGLARVIAGGFRWVFDMEGENVRAATVRAADAETYLKLSKQRDKRVRWRGGIALAVGAVTAAGALVVAYGPFVSSAGKWGLVAVVVAALGLAGRPADAPLLDTAVVRPQVAKLTSDVVTRALSVLGIGGINQAIGKSGAKAIGFPAPITRDGPGWRADVDLPFGVTAAEVMDRRDKLASGLGRPLGCVWPEGRPDLSPGRLQIWVADQAMAADKPTKWPLAKSGTVDLFKPFRFGTDPRGRANPMSLVFTNVLIGSIPGMGKTFTVKVPLAAATLDPRAELWTFELKGTGDLAPWEAVSTRYASGFDDPEIEQALQGLRDLRTELARRAKVIKGLPRHVCPENKVTPELASRKDLRLHPLVVTIDEAQELFSHSTYGDEAGELAEKCIKLGRALGVILILATQRPDKDSLPTGVSANVGTRICLRVMGQLENDMILGTSAYKQGIRATMFTKKDLGVAYMVGVADEAIVGRGDYIDGPAGEAICARGRAMREAAGTLTGHAAGQVTETPITRNTLLPDLLEIWPGTDKRAWNETLCERLAELHPDAYDGWEAADLTAALKRVAPTVTVADVGRRVDGKPVTRRGLTRSEVHAAYTESSQKRGGA
ncbi:cell division protein FtsK [Phytomonospora sp. NPDC050363]|uniref:cell division protein FtsK n=1 Tax=Phytomonospora sp. NPDC050363 TaxID=3155642 RepID=UPI0033D7F66E